MTSPKKFKYDSQHSGKRGEGIKDFQDIDFTRKSCWTDLQLKVEGRNLYVPKYHLALVSPVFRRMFESKFKEIHIDVIPLPGKKYEDVLIFLKCTHPGTRVKVTYNIIPKVLPLAHEYQIQWLLDDCTNVMLKEMDASKSPSPFNVYWKSTSATAMKDYCNIRILAEMYGLTSVIERFIERVSSICYQWYKDMSEFKKISVEVRYRILCRRLDFKDKC